MNQQHMRLILLLAVMIFTHPAEKPCHGIRGRKNRQPERLHGTFGKDYKTGKKRWTHPLMARNGLTISPFPVCLKLKPVMHGSTMTTPIWEMKRPAMWPFSTIELGIDADITEHLTGHVLFLWEEDDTEPIDLDEGFISISGGGGIPLYISAGKMYVPFGNFESNMISDPLPLELGETRESAIQAGFDAEGFYGSVYAFNGDIDEAGKDSRIDNFGANAGYAVENDNFSVDAGISYINNIVDSDGLSELVTEIMDADGSMLDKYVGGFGAHAVINIGSLMLVGEYITALDEPEFLTDVPGEKLSKEKIAAFNAELAYSFPIAGKETFMGIAWQGTDNAGDFLPESRVMGAVGAQIFENTSLALEYRHDEFKNDDEVDTVTAQLAIEF